MCEPVHISLKFSVPAGIAVGMPVTGRPPGHRRVSVHAGGGVLGGSAVQVCGVVEVAIGAVG
jgi:hypothetical protein